ncbi:lipoate-protein ligase A-like [Hylaeus volcanicus]|uniref:lipoate-protein ligase A-like n=1 Tax=Hylaeus volcanicus TaxID=313075 RepID=UPI0023B7822F|nr:lipoate-protein ligase A-like [Hylaeus volcanicus]
MFRYIRPALNKAFRPSANKCCKRSQTTLKHCFGLHDKPNSIAIVSNVNEIHFNLAVEDYLMNVLRPPCPLFFWWRNASNVVIGRHQNPWSECRWELMQQDGVDIARRFSGGGAVYQDLGNSCFTLLLPEKMYDSEKNNNIILNVLKHYFNIHGEASGRNDMVVNNKKISGSAFKQLRKVGEPNLSLQHGTLLIDTDMKAVEKYLTPNSKKLQSKGVSSVSSRVMNLKELNPNISHETLQEPLIEEFCKQYSSNEACLTFSVDKESEITKDPNFVSTYNQLKDWNWRFGKTPEFSHTLQDRLSQATVELHLNIVNGQISNVKLYTDSLFPEVVPLVEDALKANTNVKQEIDDIKHMILDRL